MEQISTQNLLLLHAYGETTPAQRVLIEKELAASPVLQQEWAELQETMNVLNGKMKSPSNTSVRIIMEHSHKTEHLQEI